MKAIVQRRYGSSDVLALEEVETPSPGADEVLVKVHAASASAGDWHLMRGQPFMVRLMMGGILKPKIAILGCAIAGTVVEAGGKVSGLLAEHVSAPEHVLVRKLAGATFEEESGHPAGKVVVTI